MIHDVTIPFRFDTSPIEEQIARIGEAEVAKAIQSVIREGIYSGLPKVGRYNYYDKKPKSDEEVDWTKVVNDRVDKFLGSHSDEIIDEAALLLAMRASRKRSWRETLAELKGEEDES